MSDDVARAIGAPSSTVIMIAGKECSPRPLTLKELSLIQRECLKQYKRQVLETFSENADLLPNGNDLVLKKADELSQLSIEDLPPKHAYDVSRLKITKDLKNWLKEEYSLLFDDNEKDSKAKPTQVFLQRVTSLALDSGTLTEEKCKELTGQVPSKYKVAYSHWWFTGTLDGMLTTVWACFKEDGITRADIEKEIGSDPARLADISREIEHLSTPAAEGNG